MYVAGLENNGTHNVAKIWKNGTATALTEGTNIAMASSVYVSGSDVYVAGSEENLNVSIAKIWKNGTPTSLTYGINSGLLTSVFVSQ